MTKATFTLRPKETGPTEQLLQFLLNRDQEKVWQVVISEYKGSKTQEQLGYYWGAWIPAIQKWLEDGKGVYLPNDQIHEWLIDEYADAVVVTIGPVTKTLKKGLSSMNVKETSEFMERVDRHCSERGLILPPPNRRTAHD